MKGRRAGGTHPPLLHKLDRRVRLHLGRRSKRRVSRGVDGGDFEPTDGRERVREKHVFRLELCAVAAPGSVILHHPHVLFVALDFLIPQAVRQLNDTAAFVHERLSWLIVLVFFLLLAK